MGKKILFIHHGWGIGGAPLSLLYFLNKLDKTRYKPIVLFLHESEATDLFRSNGYEVVVISKNNHYFKHHEKGRLKYYQVLKAIRVLVDWFTVVYRIAPKALKEIRPDIVHLNSDVLSSWALASKHANIPVVCHNRDPIAKGVFGVRRALLRAILNHTVFRIISISKDNRDRIGLPEKTVVVYNPVADEFFADYKLPNVENAVKSILFVGGVHKSKGLKLLLKSLPNLDPKVELTLAGYFPTNSTSNRLKYKWFFDTIEAEQSRVVVKGVISTEEMLFEMRKADLLVFPAIHPHFARPIIEAYACKTPVVATNLKGMDEIVKDGITGFLTAPTAVGLAERINHALGMGIALNEMGQEAFQFATANFQQSICASKIEAVYHEI